ncbi:CarD family transcriptional regulator [Methylocella tundrae]|uniref:CarD family transcriptional regulator n=1 Tax=Methylocella tundrae TaxID=227605 RepID=A0A8B6M6L1_METTU|nr:CarD family transcriptional regulator [Methylocella tundrae]VTZ50376.1 CarD family transcriptional regulator [Methylocella tundrae]
MRSAKKTGKPFETEAADIARDSARQSENRKTGTKKPKCGGETKSVAEGFAAQSKDPLQAGDVEAAGNAKGIRKPKRPNVAQGSDAAFKPLDRKASAVKARLRLEIETDGEETSVEIFAASPAAAMEKLTDSPKAKDPSKGRRSAVSVEPLPEAFLAAGAQRQVIVESSSARLDVAIVSEGGDPIEAENSPKIGRAVTPGRAAAFLNSIPGADEQKIVTKKIEKRAPVDFTADIETTAATSALSAGQKQSEPKPAEKAAATISKAAKAPSAGRQGFKPNEFIVYPAHGVGQIVAIEDQEVAGFKLELYVISFVKDKMILKVPVPKVASVGMRKLAEADVVKKALDTLAGRARIKRTMWSRRAQEYEAKINSGDLIAIAEVVRDLYRSDAQPEQSYSERQLYEAALDRMAREVVIVQKLTETESLKTIEAQLQKGPRRGKAEEIDVEDVDADIEEAA